MRRFCPQMPGNHLNFSIFGLWRCAAAQFQIRFWIWLVEMDHRRVILLVASGSRALQYGANYLGFLVGFFDDSSGSPQFNLNETFKIYRKLYYQGACKSTSMCIAMVLRTTAFKVCLLYTSPSPRDATLSRMPSSA